MSNTETLTSPRNFDAALESFMDFAQSLISDNEGPGYPDDCRTVLISEKGRKYVKVIRTGIEDGSTRRSVYCFVEMSTGNILKAESWKRPAKGVRGNIFNQRENAVTPWGAIYFR